MSARRRSGYAKAPKGLTPSKSEPSAVNLSARKPRKVADLISPALRQQVQRLADSARMTMVIGWQRNDVPPLKSIGYCPKAAAGSAFVYHVLETIEPSPGVQTQAMQEMAAAVIPQNEPSGPGAPRSCPHGQGFNCRQCYPAPKAYTRAEIRDGTGFAPDMRFVVPPKGSALAQVLADPSKLRAVLGAQLPELRPFRLRTHISSNENGRCAFVVDHDMTPEEALQYVRFHFTAIELMAHQEVKTSAETYLQELLADPREALGWVFGEVTFTLYATAGCGPALTFIQEAV